MTDLQKFIDCYKQFGVDIVLNTNKDGNIEVFLSNEKRSISGTTVSDKFTGYSSFYSSVEFTQDGTFISQGFWE